jgi:hypothetical protein
LPGDALAGAGNSLFLLPINYGLNHNKLSVETTKMIQIELWLYGPLARYAGEQSNGSYAQLNLDLPANTTMRDLLDRFSIPHEDRGITFINGKLAALPGLDADLEIVLNDGDRVGISHNKSMWPFQYRFGASQTKEVQETFRQRKDRGIHHAYTKLEE